MIGSFIVVRTYSAGVHCGEVESIDSGGKLVVLRNARRIWRWAGANTLNEVATAGVAQEYTRISTPVEKIVLTEAIELIPTTAEARANLERSRWGQ